MTSSLLSTDGALSSLPENLAHGRRESSNATSESGSDKKNRSTLSYDDSWNFPATCNVCKCCCFFNHSLASSVTCTAWQRLARARKQEKENAHRFAMFPAELPTHSKTTSDDFPGQFWSCSSEVRMVNTSYLVTGENANKPETSNAARFCFFWFLHKIDLSIWEQEDCTLEAAVERSVKIICINYKHSTEVLWALNFQCLACQLFPRAFGTHCCNLRAMKLKGISMIGILANQNTPPLLH